MKFFTRALQILICLVVLCVSVGLIHAQTPQQSPEAGYELPYAGLLPDHPLYMVKAARDSFWLFFTRDSIKKAELLLLFSDKKVVMAQALADKDKWDLAAEQLDASEKDVSRMIEAINLSKRIGSSLSEDFIDTALQSNNRHLEIMRNMRKYAPDKTRDQVEAAMQMNIDHYNELKKL